jgi:excisionase family DNA binding protein
LDIETVIMNVEEVASWLRIPPSTLYSLCRQGKIPCIKIGKHWRFDRKHIENWLDQKIYNGCIPETLPFIKQEDYEQFQGHENSSKGEIK